MVCSMSAIHDWARTWGVSPVAVLDLLQRLGQGATTPQDTGKGGESEAAVSNEVRLDAAKHDCILWRNNVGAYLDDRGVMIRYGLCNDTKKLNESIKSHDLIGIRKVLITQGMVGTVLGQFVSRECKERGWVYCGTQREVAQAKFGDIVISMGGDASFTTGKGSL